MEGVSPYIHVQDQGLKEEEERKNMGDMGDLVELEEKGVIHSEFHEKS